LTGFIHENQAKLSQLAVDPASNFIYRTMTKRQRNDRVRASNNIFNDGLGLSGKARGCGPRRYRIIPIDHPIQFRTIIRL
jgi:hypothetical protein